MVCLQDCMMEAGVPSSNQKKFVWTNVVLPDEPLDWPVRPASSQELCPSCRRIYKRLWSTHPFGQCTMPPEGQGRPPLSDIVAYDLPFMFYRQRTDLSNQPYIQISPLFEEINVEGSTLNDPFFYHAHYNFGAGTFDAIYYIDNVGLVDDAKYRYQLLTLDATGELQAVFGPSEEVTIEEP